MSREQAKEIVNITGLVFDVNDTGFGDGSVSVSVANVFANQEEAALFLEALGKLCLFP